MCGLMAGRGHRDEPTVEDRQGRSTCGLMAGRGHRGEPTVEDTDRERVRVD